MKAMRRILIFSLTYYPLHIGGAEVAVKEITDRIPASEIKFDMIAIGDGRGINREEIGNVTVYRVLSNLGFIRKLLYPFAAAKLAYKLHANKKYDETWAIMASYGGYAAYLFKKKNPVVPFILTIQEGDHFERRAGIFAGAFKRIFRSADKVQAISNFLMHWARSMGAVADIEVVPNGVDFDKFARPIGGEERMKLRRGAGFDDKDTVIVTASRLVEKNAVDDIISSLQYLDSSCKLLILGSGPDERKLKDLSHRLKLGSRIVFYGFVSHDELPKYLQSSDIFVRPSRTEGLGNSFLEAMAAGVPVIGTQVGGISDFLKDGETGLICEVNNPKSIAQKVTKLVRDAESRSYISREAKKMVDERFRWENVSAEMKKIFENTQSI